MNDYLPAQPSRPGWKPVRHTVFRDAGLAERIHDEGYAVVSLWSEKELEELQAIGDREHRVQPADGGMFYSVYSQDLGYRRRVHDQVAAIMRPIFEKHFVDYRNVINMFVIKAPGLASEFGVHQDSTTLDEFRFSPLSLWSPLCDVDEDNGALCLVPRSHRFFSPYRGVSFPFPFAPIKHVVREYLRPIPMRRGEALIFDNRLVHCSLPNRSARNRDAIVSGIFPAQADFQVCFKQPGLADAPIEIFEQGADWLLNYPNFLQHCHERPVSGTVVGHARFDFEPMDEAEFRAVCSRHGVAAVQAMPPASAESCNMIPEPVP
ncbi:phytanoyl-CoA dioxygenase family protein [Thermomonas carbonis]|uniref:Phytanoyl-CoA dioxygenase family protein n=1 Tax=Thermomonas carbonis TaxID=1463158 RepID=A0A7G9SMQ5_9GAMM|nr:phytanoyl-CoA dioxygenase family protein [Thermomonas carbonis]QNN69130.1 phytanoyl-CoA dioxygenase family protein [Thermomonas carbonis]GHC06548.1 hypothetical protein GCM10010080_20880 [Thermomonas carbonis]